MKKTTIDNIFFVFIGCILGAAFMQFLNAANELGPVFWLGGLGFIGGLCTFFLDFLISPGNIFGWWDTRVLAWFNKPKNPLRLLYKPLGGCLYCMNVWVVFALFLMTWSTHNLALWYMFPIGAIAHTVLNLTDKHLNG